MESKSEQERRAWVERQETFRDAEEAFVQRKAAASTPEERQSLNDSFHAKRRAHREEDIALGKRGTGLGIATHQIMWARWLEIAVEHELEARRAFWDMPMRPHSEPLKREFNLSLVAITGAAATIEALYGDIKYLIPPRTVRDNRRALRQAIDLAFGLSTTNSTALAGELAWLFPLRDFAVHAYTETLPVVAHPAGVNSGVEHSNFNALTCGRAVDAAMSLLRFAASPPAPRNRWIERWVTDRSAYHSTVVQPLQQLRDAIPLQTPARRLT